MTDKALRELQDRFIEALEEDGFHERVKDGMTVSLFEPGSPSIIALQRDLFPRYATKMNEYLELVSDRTNPQRQPKPAHYRHHGKTRPDQEDSGEGAVERVPVREVQQRDSTGQAGQEVSVVPVKRLVKRVIRQGE